MQKEGEDPSVLYQDGSELPLGLGIYYEAFWLLHTSRQIGMAVGPIPHTEILLFCQLRKLDPVTSATMEHHVRAMDNMYLYHVRKQHDKDLKKKRGRH